MTHTRTTQANAKEPVVALPGARRGRAQIGKPLPRPSAAHRRLALVFLTIAALTIATFLAGGCNAIPRDSAGALQRVRSNSSNGSGSSSGSGSGSSSGELRVGVADNPPWVRFDGERVTGIEPELIEAWAKQLGTRVRWRRGAEAELVEALHRRDLDVLAAGLDSKTPHQSKIAPTQPYVDVEDPHGKKKKRVLAVTQGESALLFSLDRFLAAQDKTALRRRAHQMQWGQRSSSGEEQQQQP